MTIDQAVTFVVRMADEMEANRSVGGQRPDPVSDLLGIDHEPVLEDVVVGDPGTSGPAIRVTGPSR